ncbi:hypothetical protein CTZ27_25140 [Streptomyces griseocarneus]|nr:hypothetical protein CTZ27_25140 [Streptomyces griseocarneus]
MTTTKKSTGTADETQPTGSPAPQIVGPPLRQGQIAERVTLAHHLRIGGRDYRPGDAVHVSPDYARQLRRSGYIARERT